MAKKGTGFSGHGGLFTGTIVNCDSKDSSTYCTIVKFFNLFIMFLVVSYVFYFFYPLLKKYLFKKGKK